VQRAGLAGSASAKWACERLAAQEFKVTTLTRNPEGRERAARANLQGEAEIGGFVAGAHILVSAVNDDAALLDIVFKAGGLKETLSASHAVAP